MATYSFETITAAEALAIAAGDKLTVATGSASQTTVLFAADGSLSVTIGARTVLFGTAFGSLTRDDAVSFPDGSRLYVGSAVQDTRDFGFATAIKGAVYAGDGDDRFTAGAGAWLLQGNQGNDQFTAHSGFANTIYGGQGDDAIGISSGPSAPVGQFVQGNKGNDSIVGNGADTILGGQGDDRITGGFEASFLNGNLGNDVMFGSGRLFGEGGDDTMTSLNGVTNMAFGGDGADVIRSASSDGIDGGSQNFLYGEAGNDSLGSRSPEHDVIEGGDGDDFISNNNVVAKAGDLLDGGLGNDTIVALVGDDELRGGAGNDSLRGGDGADSLVGGDGADTLSGDVGADLFVITASQAVLDASGGDRILNWTVGDKLTYGPGAPRAYAEATAGDFSAAFTLAQGRMSAGLADVVAVEVGSDVVIFADAGSANTVHTIVTLVGRSLADISEDNVF